jgi:serine/threonine-protein kinase
VKTCTTCGKEYPDTTKFCPLDGSTLRSKNPTADLIGQVIADRYNIVKKLGEGGMGAVYLGEHVKMGRKSAIKVMAPSMANDPDAISRFNREAANASRISHANVCQIYDFGETPEGIIYLAMEFIEGQALTDLIEKEGALEPRRAAHILKQAADGLAAAHDLGMVHRDIKPDNIMIVQGRDGTDIVKVVDFGIAKAVQGDDTSQKVTKTGLVVGTPEYMSPEQLAGDKLDGRSDLYSLALVLYRMLTGVLPFQAETSQEMMIKRLTDDPMTLVDARPDIAYPPKMQLVLDKALQRTAADRYGDARDFGNETMDAVAGLAAVPETRVDQQRVSAMATQVMDTEAALKLSTKYQAAAKKGGAKGGAAPAAAPVAAPAPKKFPMALAVVGGLVVVAAVGGGALAFINKGNGTPPDSVGGLAVNPPTAPDTGKATGAAPSPPPAPGNPPGTSKTLPTNPGTPPGTSKRDTTAVTPPAPPPGPAPVANWADTLTAANDAFDADQNTRARALASAVFTGSGATAALKASAAVLVAATYGAESNTTRALDWYRNAQRYATGAQLQRVEAAIRDLGGTP